MNLDLDKLEAAARAATPGPWEWDGRRVDPDDGYVHIPECSYIVGLISLAGHYEGYQEDCDFIAATSPDVVLELVRRLRAAEANEARYQYLRDEAWKRKPGLHEGGRAGLMIGRHGEELDRAVDIARAAQGADHG